ncbi:MAG: peptidase T [Pirellulales bacterium]|nr:peptidase T [Pirellulales bacterium]
MNADRLLERFLKYVQIDTTARPDAAEYPSSSGQLALGKVLVDELRALGIADAQQDEHGIVLGTLPASVEGERPVVALCAHLDTSPETSGENIRPQVIRDYPGGDITLPADPAKVIRVADNPELSDLIGRTLITTDGTTLLGGDDKAGVAVIMETIAWLGEHPELRHGPIRVCFTCDEEIGHGTDHIDLARLGATVCYTLDGQGANTIDVETFSADLAIVTIRGVNIHPGNAKNRMTNAVRVAADFVASLPRRTLSPETTDGRQGFLHPYEMGGGVGEVVLKILLRDFDESGLADRAEVLRHAAALCEADHPEANVDVQFRRQYRNLAEGLAKEPRAVDYARQALRRLGREPSETIVRGGTDGSRLTEMGLPTPNLSCGQHTPHSNLEWACLDQMVEAAEWLVSLAEIWAGAE